MKEFLQQWGFFLSLGVGLLVNLVFAFSLHKLGDKESGKWIPWILLGSLIVGFGVIIGMLEIGGTKIS